MIIKLLAVTASGLMLAAALPKFDLTFFLWIGLIPLLWALQGVRGRKAFILGTATGWRKTCSCCTGLFMLR